ncbi:MAG: hypothetical protein FWB76_01915 [Oscillospiraceae bacterium]|nr:hypothetical protein [Oscillospiraceae bacterium]
MLKLLKHEFHQSGRIFMWLLIISAGAGLIGALVTLGQDPGPGQFAGAVLLNAAILFGAGVMQIVGVILLLVNTNRSMFSERGYLTFSLPVSSTALLGGKLLTNVVLMLVNMALALSLVAVTVSNITRVLAAAGDDLLYEVAPEAMGAFVEFPPLNEFVLFIGFFLIEALVFLVLAMMVVLFVITLSHVRSFQRRSGLWTFIFLVAITIVCWLAVSNITPLLPAINVHLNFGGQLAGGLAPVYNVSSAFVMLALATGFFFITNWLLKRKISLK